jgi:hypothetical protein
MRTSRLGIVVCIIAGSFFVYCGQSAMTMMGHGHGDGGAPHDGSSFVGDAMGQMGGGGGTCCSAPARETPTVLFDDLVKPTPTGTGTQCAQMSPAWDVSGYRTIILHAPSCNYVAQFRNGKAGFVIGATGACLPTYTNGPQIPRVLQLDTLSGHELRINFSSSIAADDPDGTVPCDSPPIALTVVGYRNP